MVLKHLMNVEATLLSSEPPVQNVRGNGTGAVNRLDADAGTTAMQFFESLRDTFDILYAEGARLPKMISVVHARMPDVQRE